MATLTSSGTPISGELVDFQIGSTELGEAVTGSNGIAEIDNVSLAGLDAATFVGDITASFAGDSKLAPSSGSDLTVTPAPLTITANDLSKVYGAALPTLTASYTGPRQRRHLGQPDHPAHGDDHRHARRPCRWQPLRRSPPAAPSIPIIRSAMCPGSLSVTQAPLTITADDQTMVYGTALPTLTASYTGFVNGDTSANLTTLPTVTTTATPASHVDQAAPTRSRPAAPLMTITRSATSMAI